MNNLSPFLLAAIVARSDKSKQPDLAVRRLKERFRVVSVESLTVNYELQSENLIRSIEFRPFYIQKERKLATGIIEEFYFTLFVVGNSGASILEFDGDALGESLASIFVDEGEQVAGLFPRITAKYTQCRGDRALMADFLLFQLGISQEALERAAAMIRGEVIGSIPEPPPPQWTTAERQSDQIQEGARRKLLEQMQKHQQDVARKTTTLLGSILSSGPHDQTKPPDVSTGTRKSISPKQEDRGARGEEEIKRRFLLPGGWQGFTLIRDMRKDDCGYDFLCKFDGDEVKVEVKTFAKNGRMVLGSTEVQAAATFGDNYYLLGVLDDGDVEANWKSFLSPNPIVKLLTSGEFNIDAKLVASPGDIFDGLP